MPTGGKTFNVLAGDGEVSQGFTVTASSPFDRVTLAFEIVGDWLDFRVGSTDGGEQILEKTRLYPGSHIMSFTPVATSYVVFSADKPGTRSVTEPVRVTDADMELTTVYAIADVRAIKTTQIEEGLFLFHLGYCPRLLQRHEQDSWSLRKFLPRNGPFLPINASNILMGSNVLAGNGQLIAYQANGDAADFFRAGHVDALFKLVHPGQRVSVVAAAAGDYTDAIRVFGIDQERVFTPEVSGTFVGTWVLQRSVGNEDDFKDTGTTGTGAYSTPFDDGLDNQVVYYRLKLSAYTSGSPTMTLTYNGGSTEGVCRVTSVESGSVASMTVLEPFSAMSNTRNWYEGAWSDLRGWPTAGEFHDGRLFLIKGTYRYASQPDDFESFELTDDDASAINRQSTVGKSADGVWIKSAARLTVGSEENESFLSTGALDEAITATNVSARLAAGRGSNGVDAQVFDTSLLWPDASGERLIEMAFADGYSITDLTRLHTTIAGGGWIESAAQMKPEPRWWGVREDGQMSVLLYSREEGVACWQRWRREGDSVKSVCVVPGRPEDDVFVVMEREIDGDPMWFVEVLEDERWTDLTDVHRLHCAVTYEGAATTALTAAHLPSMDVVVWADGYAVDATTNVSGQVTLATAVTKAHVGLEARAKYRSARLAYAGNAGGAVMAMKKVAKLGLEIYQTPPGILWIGESFDSEFMAALADRITDTLTMDSELQTYTGLVWEPLESSHGVDSRFVMEARLGGPATVLGMYPQMEVNPR